MFSRVDVGITVAVTVAVSVAVAVTAIVTLEYIEYGRWVVFAIVHNGLVVTTTFYLFVGR